jgi:transposase
VDTKKGTLKRGKVMKERKYRVYPDEFKIEALELLKHSDKSAAQIEKELGITPGLLVKWKVRFQIKERADNSLQIEPNDLEQAKKEIKRLRKELAEEREEKEILKKVVNIFSRKSE